MNNDKITKIIENNLSIPINLHLNSGIKDLIDERKFKEDIKKEFGVHICLDDIQTANDICNEVNQMITTQDIYKNYKENYFFQIDVKLNNGDKKYIYGIEALSGYDIQNLVKFVEDTIFGAYSEKTNTPGILRAFNKIA